MLVFGEHRFESHGCTTYWVSAPTFSWEANKFIDRDRPLLSHDHFRL